jgi:hypothetical protein
VAHRVAAKHSKLVGHPWLVGATRYCFEAIGALDAAPHAIVLRFAVNFLDAVHDSHAEAAPLLERLAEFIPPDGLVPVAGGSEGETLLPLDFAPLPDRPARKLFSRRTVAGRSISPATRRQLSSSGAGTRRSRPQDCCSATGSVDSAVYCCRRSLVLCSCHCALAKQCCGRSHLLQGSAPVADSDELYP